MSSFVRFTLDLFMLAFTGFNRAVTRASIGQTLMRAPEYHPKQCTGATGINLFYPLFILLSSCLVSELLLPSVAAAEPNLHVRSESALSAEIDQASMQIIARLADEFGRGIPDRLIALDGPEGLLGRATTDRLGRAIFSVQRERWRRLSRLLPEKAQREPVEEKAQREPVEEKAQREPVEGSATIRLRFDGDASYDPALLRIKSLLPRAAVELIPSLDRSSPLLIDDEAPRMLRVHARSSKGAAGINITLRDETGALIGSAITDSLGRVSFELAPTRAMNPGENSILIESSGDEERAPSSVRLAFTLLQRTSLEILSAEARADGALLLEGALRSSRDGPAPAAPIELLFEDGERAQNHTDSSGIFRFNLDRGPRDDVLRGVLIYRGDDRGGLAASDPLELILPVISSGRGDVSALLFALSPFALIALGFALRAWQLRAPKRLGRARAAALSARVTDPGRLAARLFRRSAPRLRIVDARSGAPLEGVRLLARGELIARTDATGRTPPLSLLKAGALPLPLELEREGYLNEMLELTIPFRDGSLHEVALERLRDAPSRALLRLAEARGKLPAELLAHSHRKIASAIAREGEDLERLADAVDRLYYGPGSPAPYDALVLRAQIEALGIAQDPPNEEA